MTENLPGGHSDAALDHLRACAIFPEGTGGEKLTIKSRRGDDNS
jgi:hypothetical protein